MKSVLNVMNSPYHTVVKWLTVKFKLIRNDLCSYSFHDIFQFVENIKQINCYNVDIAQTFKKRLM